MGNSQVLKSLRLLYVEDDETQRKELASFLRRRVDKLYLASQGEEGLEKFRQMEPDAVLCDLRMPRMDGLEMATKIRELNRVVPIIILTALSDKETILTSVNMNITNYLIKPVDIHQLVKVLEETAVGLKDLGVVETGNTLDREKLNLLKNEMTKFIKVETGKGPSDVRISVQDERLKIHIIGALTTYEKSLLAKETNLNLVNYNRNVFFQDRMDGIKEMIHKLLLLNVQLNVLDTAALVDETTITFKIV